MTEFEAEGGAERLELDPAEERRLCELLRSAYAPSDIDPARHERLLLSALEDPFAPPSAEELVESERLRQALDGDGHDDHADLALARALSAAFAPAATNTTAATEPRAAAVITRAPRAKSNVILFRFAGGGAALAAAAAVLLAILPKPRLDTVPDLPALALVQSRSTAALFRADSAGAASSRIDRIASVRSRDLRDNRYAIWGVR